MNSAPRGRPLWRPPTPSERPKLPTLSEHLERRGCFLSAAARRSCLIQTLRFGWFFGIQVFMGVAAGVVASVGAGPILFLPMFTIVHIVWCLSLLSWGAPTYFRRILSFGVRPSVTVVPTHAEGLLLFAAPAVTLTTLGAAILQLPVDYVFAVGLVELFGAFTILATGGRHLLVRP